jgi:hypothetical protein
LHFGRLHLKLIVRVENIKRKMTMWSNPLAGVGAGRTLEFIEMMQVGVSYKSGSARLVGR